jgi:hypothetical protein
MARWWGGSVWWGCSGRRSSERLSKMLDARHIVQSVECLFTLATSLLKDLRSSLRLSTALAMTEAAYLEARKCREL